MRWLKAHNKVICIGGFIIEYIASLSYGKDSIVIPEICRRHGLPLDRIVHIEIMATDSIPADSPPMMEFKKRADMIIKERYGIEVERLRDTRNYEERFMQKLTKGREKGRLRGWPFTTNAKSWCKHLKTDVLNSIERDKNITQYVGIAADEPNRFHNLTDRKRSPLVEFGYTEADCRMLAEELGLLSPIYSTAARGGGAGSVTIKAYSSSDCCVRIILIIGVCCLNGIAIARYHLRQMDTRYMILRSDFS